MKSLEDLITELVEFQLKSKGVEFDSITQIYISNGALAIVEVESRHETIISHTTYTLYMHSGTKIPMKFAEYVKRCNE